MLASVPVQGLPKLTVYVWPSQVWDTVSSTHVSQTNTDLWVSDYKALNCIHPNCIYIRFWGYEITQMMRNNSKTFWKAKCCFISESTKLTPKLNLRTTIFLNFSRSATVKKMKKTAVLPNAREKSPDFWEICKKYIFSLYTPLFVFWGAGE